MSRKRRHIQARHDEWIVVHRPRRAGGGDDAAEGCLGMIIAGLILLFLLHSC